MRIKRFLFIAVMSLMSLFNILGFVKYTPLITFNFWYQLLTLTVCLIYFQLRSVSIGNITLSLSLAIYLPIIFVFGIGEAMWISCLVTLIHSLVTKKKWVQFFINCTQRSFSALVTGKVFLLLGGQIGSLSIPDSLIPVLVASLIYNVINICSVVVISILMGRLKPMETITFINSTSHAWFSTVLFAYVGALFSIFIAIWHTYGLVLFMVLLFGISETMLYGVKLNAEQQLRMQVEKELIFDPKTKVYNYRYLRKWLESSFGSQPVAVLFIDIDDFKVFNDQYGHDRGDQALKNVASAIAKSVRTIDRVVRFGGEEFVVILPNMKGNQALKVAKRIQERLTTLPESSMEYPVTVSIGIAAYPEDAKDMHELLRVADMAMYQAKVSGKNQSCVFCSETHLARGSG